MKILVLSDSHGHEDYVEHIMSLNTDSNLVIHLGDGEDDLRLPLMELPAFGNKRIIQVRGNCDWGGSGLGAASFDNIGGYRFLCTHGHMQQVKSGVELLWEEAKMNDRNVVLFGHTHRQFYEERDGIHLFNPGAAKDLHYGIILIDEKKGKIEFRHI